MIPSLFFVVLPFNNDQYYYSPNNFADFPQKQRIPRPSSDNQAIIPAWEGRNRRRGWKYGESEGQSLQRDTRLRAPRKRVIQILYSIMQINMRRIKLSLEFVGRWGKRRMEERDRSRERFLCFFGNKSLPAPIYLFLSLISSLEFNLLRFPSVLWLADAVTSGDMPLFHKGEGVCKGGNVGSLRHVVHMSSGNGKYCVGNVARRVSNFATFIALASLSLSLFLSLSLVWSFRMTIGTST